MSLETERKFLIKPSWRDTIKRESWQCHKFEQGYLVKEGTCAIRVRLQNSSSSFGKAYITFKSTGASLSREEFEYEIPLDDGKSLLKMCSKPYVIKTRHFVLVGEQDEWTIDEFEGINKGLFLAEIELQCENQAINLPEWIDREVTGDVRYMNAHLSTNKVI